MLMVLIILVVISLLGATTVEVASWELKISHYESRAEQAQQAADAGVDWAAERIYLHLVNRQDEADLPMFINLQPEIIPQRIGSNLADPGSPNFVISNWQAIRVSNETANPVVYKLTSTGNLGNAYKKIAVELSYRYTGGNIDTVTGLPKRDYSMHRGGISSYRIE